MSESLDTGSSVPRGEPGSATSDSSDAARDIFRCPGIERQAIQMRRRVQVGATLEICGTQASNYLYHSDWNAYVVAMENFHFENSALLLGVHVMLMWWYQSFLRDALLARHVTRIALVEGSQPSIAPPSGEAEAEASEKPICTLLVETGPWVRRVDLMRPRARATSRGEVDEHAAQIPFGAIVELGLLHVDRKRGELVDPEAFERLLRDGLVGGEEITTNNIHADAAFVSRSSMLPFLADAGVSLQSAGAGDGSSMLEKLKKNEWLHRTFQLPGGPCMVYFGNMALVLGAGTVAWWAVPTWR